MNKTKYIFITGGVVSGLGEHYSDITGQAVKIARLKSHSAKA